MEYPILTGLGLAAPSGLNAYLPLLILALADRFSDDVTLDRPYDFLSSTWGIVVILALLTVEVVVDKVPGFDHANDLVQSAVRPAAGAISMMAVTHDQSSLNPVIAMIIGLGLAGSVHAGKALSRPVITVSTGGLGNPVISVVEDAVAVVTAVVAIVFPILALFLLAIFALFLAWAYRRIRRFRLRGPTHPPAATTLHQ